MGKIVLASQSPRRRELLGLIVPAFEIEVAAFDEAAVEGESPARLAQVLAEGKAAVVAAGRPEDTVIGSDTVVACGSETLGKPQDEADAMRMIELLSGRWHEVHTGVAIYRAGVLAESFVDTTRVLFAPVKRAAIEAYVKTEEPYDKAGGYGIQGWAAGYIPRIEGCYHSVMGLPVAALHEVLCKLETI